jgi:hypothetical protein
MPVLYEAGDVPVWQVVVAAVLCAAGTVWMARIAVRIYSNSILRTGPRISFRQAIRESRNSLSAHHLGLGRRLLQGETWRPVRNQNSFGGAQGPAGAPAAASGTTDRSGQTVASLSRGQNKDGAFTVVVCWLSLFPRRLSPVPSQKGFIDDRYREFRP